MCLEPLDGLKSQVCRTSAQEKPGSITYKVYALPFESPKDRDDTARQELGLNIRGHHGY